MQGCVISTSNSSKAEKITQSFMRRLDPRCLDPRRLDPRRLDLRRLDLKRLDPKRLDLRHLDPRRRLDQRPITTFSTMHCMKA